MSGVLRRLAPLTRPHASVLALAVLFLTANSLVESVVIPVLFTLLLMVVIGPSVAATGGASLPVLGATVTAWLEHEMAGVDRQHALWLLALAGLGAVVLKALFTSAKSILAHQFSFLVAQDVRRKMFAALLAQSPDFYRRELTGTLVARITNDVHLLHDTLGVPLFEVVQAPIGLVLALGMMVAVNPWLTLTTLCVAPVAALFISWFTRLVRKLTLARQSEYARLSGYLAERLAAVRLIQACGREVDETERLSAVDASFFRKAIRSMALAESLGPASEVVVAIGMLVGLVVGGLSVLRGTMTPEQFVLFFALAPSATTQIGRLARIDMTRQQLAAAATRIFEVLDARPTTTDLPGATALTSCTGGLTFEHVTFAYESDEPALVDLTLDVPAGSMVALVGPSGGGKTTLASLIPRFFEPQRGRVLIDGVDIRRYTTASLRAQIGLVAQEALLLNDTIADNIRYGRPDATFEQIRAAARAANALEFIEAMPAGFDTMIAERGQSMSGGQRQRVAIARALLRAPRILILDEATSALDSASEREVQEAIDHVVEGRTTIVIAHRLSTIIKADRIVVIGQGRIVEQGTHTELVASGGLYRMLFDAQFRDVATLASMHGEPGPAGDDPRVSGV